MRRLRAWVWFVFSAASLTLATGPGCGGGDTNSTFVDHDATAPGNDAGSGQSDAFVIRFDSGATGDSGSSCHPRTCQQANANCGPIGDGCGGVVDCGKCTAPQTCGGGGMPSQCGGTMGCVPKTCQQLGFNCGPAGDGCGGVLNCGTCTAPQTCGGGNPGQPGVCGGMANCVPTTCAKLGYNCGPAADGCGGLLDCGPCTAPETCGGAGQPSVCGNGNPLLNDAGADAGNPSCTPKTCAQQGIQCGPAGDGCGNQIDCGSCVAPQTCGGGGVQNQCGGSGACVPLTCQQIGATCGIQGNGCGGTVDCGTCVSPNTCGGGGTLNQCGNPGMNCTPLTCQQQNANCGQVADGCGGLTPNCGTCTAPDICGGGGIPNQCGNTVQNDGGGPCVNLCPLIPQCDSGTTTISGTVVAPTIPNAAQGIVPDPLYGALVYIPNSAGGALDPLPDGVSCDTCNAQASGSPLASATTGPDGKFVLKNVPANMNNGPAIPLVIQLGKWRREVFLPSNTVKPCQDNPIGTDVTRLPRKQKESSQYDNIPLFAIDTGNVDALECVLRKMGIADTEFGNPPTSGPAYQAGAPRIQFYQATPTTNGAGGAIINNSTPGESSFWTDVNVMKQYDVALMECEGGEDPESANGNSTQEQNMVAYANAGGRVYNTHYSYVWLWRDAWKTTADWSIASNAPGVPDPVTATVDVTFQKGKDFSSWLQVVGAASNPGGNPSQMSIAVSRNNAKSVNTAGGSQQWIYAKNNNNTQFPLHYTFNTPYGAMNQCGRVLFSDFHVNNASSNGVRFPNECTTGKMTAQEKILEFMLFDLTSCIKPDVPPPPSCTPQTCQQLGVQCGPAGDGCGNIIQCGPCTPPQTCGGGGVPSKCGGGCVPKTCQQLGLNCGPAGDGCGGSLDCGTCTPPQSCGGGGQPGVCGGFQCTPLTCQQQGISCGPAGDGCGNAIDCGSCPNGQLCGGGGVPGVCGAPDGGFCTPLTCQQQGIDCGPAGDGCGNLIQCGTCPNGQICGAGGPGKCGSNNCTPLTCQQQNINCGPAGDGCGNALDCGMCTAPDTCGGGGTPGQCGHPNCTPLTCAQQNANCGSVADGCGGTIDCGTCQAGCTCGLTQPNVCGCVK